MKPIIVQIDKNNDKITLTKEELEKIISDVYQEGYSDGSKTPITYPLRSDDPTNSYEPTVTYNNGLWYI